MKGRQEAGRGFAFRGIHYVHLGIASGPLLSVSATRAYLVKSSNELWCVGNL